VVLSNYSGTELTVNGVAVTGPDASAFAVTQDNCSGVTVPPDGSCRVRFRFNPTRVGGHSAQVEFANDAEDPPPSASLTGTGVDPAALIPASIAFGSRGDHTTTGPRTVTLSNLGAANLEVSSVALAGGDATSFRLSGDACSGATLATGQSCTVQVRFRPLGTGAKATQLRFDDSAPTSPHTVALSGTGTPAPWLERSTRALKFGYAHVGSTSPSKTVTLSNVGSAAMTITAITKEGANPSDFRNLTETCTAVRTLNPGETCTASIAFRPTATGVRTARLTISDSAPRNPHHVALSGTGR
jgi:hypothetical protein